MGKSDLDDLLPPFKYKSSECVESTRTSVISSLLFSLFLSLVFYCSTREINLFLVDFLLFFLSQLLSVTSDFKPKPCSVTALDK